MPKKNGFFWFMLEHRKRLEAKGHRFRSLEDVVPLAGKVWEKMNAKERERYASRDAKKKPGTAVHTKPAHASVAKTEKIKDEKLNDESKPEELMIAMLEKRLRKAEIDDTIARQDFYIISMEYFCHTDDGIYFPAELGVIKFNLECGVQEQLHLLINPGKLPYGFALQAQQHAANNHALPLPPYALGETDFEGIALKILTFLTPENDDSPPMLFTAAKSVPVVESMLHRMLDHRIGKRPLYVCTVAELLFRVKLAVERHMMSMTIFPSLVMAQQIIDADMFAYTPKISCEYHESHGLLEHCALAQCIRWAYTISENCCKELGIDLIPGKHVPIDTIVDTIVPQLPDGCATADLARSIVLPDKHLGRFDDAVVDEEHPGCSGMQRPSPAEHPKAEPDLFEMLEQQRKGEGNVKRVSIREPQVLDDDEIRRGVVIKLKESETFNVRGPGRGRGVLMNDYLDPAVMGRGQNSQRRGVFHPPSRGRGYSAPMRGRGR